MKDFDKKAWSRPVIEEVRVSETRTSKVGGSTENNVFTDNPNVS